MLMHEVLGDGYFATHRYLADHAPARAAQFSPCLRASTYEPHETKRHATVKLRGLIPVVLADKFDFVLGPGPRGGGPGRGSGRPAVLGNRGFWAGCGPDEKCAKCLLGGGRGIQGNYVREELLRPSSRVSGTAKLRNHYTKMSARLRRTRPSR